MSAAGGHGEAIVVRSWEEYLGHIVDGRFANWAFRGQRVAAWPLDTSLGRYLRDFAVDRRAWRPQEERILRIFKRKAPNLLAQPPAPDDHFQWLALMEHHGAPTRLLDFTWSPYVAAFFALEHATGDAAVWAVDPRRILAHARRATRGSAPGRIDPREPSNLERWFLRGRRPLLWLGEPERMNRRLVAQSGTFLVPSVLDRSIDQLMHDDAAMREACVRLVLRPSMRDRAMRQLYSMNLTRATLFPDLDGLAGSLAYELEFHWGYDPRHLTPRPRAAGGRRHGVKRQPG